MINTYFLLIIALVVALSFLKTFWTNSTFMYGYIVTYRLLNAFAKIGLFSIAMQFCSRSISASQFTIFMTLGATGSIVGAAFIGPVKENFGWEMTFLFFAGMIGLALVVLQFVNIDAHIKRINEMDRETAERQLVEIE